MTAITCGLIPYRIELTPTVSAKEKKSNARNGTIYISTFLQVCNHKMTSLTMNSKLTLNNGLKIPVIAMGVYMTPAGVASQVAYNALKVGYRHIDSAEFYKNEKEVGEGISKWLQESPNNKREDVFYVTKIFDFNHGYEKAKRAIDECLQKVKDLQYIDMVLIHSPQSNRTKRLETWKALQEAVNSGRIKSIGVSNYGVHHMIELLEWDGLEIKPVVNQVELNPWLMRTHIVDYAKANGIVMEAYSPLTRGKNFHDPTLVQLAKKYQKTPAQVLIRWSLQQGFVVLPKSEKKDRAVENINVFDFDILSQDMKLLSHPESSQRFTNWDPTTYQD